MVIIMTIVIMMIMMIFIKLSWQHKRSMWHEVVHNTKVM